MARCLPCQSDHHQECTHSQSEACDCLICIAQRIGEQILEDFPHLTPQDRDAWAAQERDDA